MFLFSEHPNTDSLLLCLTVYKTNSNKEVSQVPNPKSTFLIVKGLVLITYFNSSWTTEINLHHSTFLLKSGFSKHFLNFQFYFTPLMPLMWRKIIDKGKIFSIWSKVNLKEREICNNSLQKSDAQDWKCSWHTFPLTCGVAYSSSHSYDKLGVQSTKKCISICKCITIDPLPCRNVTTSSPYYHE